MENWLPTQWKIEKRKDAEVAETQELQREAVTSGAGRTKEGGYVTPPEA